MKEIAKYAVMGFVVSVVMAKLAKFTSIQGGN